jgi:hypothetical protein
MGIKQGPETVFDDSVGEIIPDLIDARETGRNGRVGREMVFWEYRLAGGEQAYFYACAPVKNTDCGHRRQLICGRDMRLISESERSGRISRFRCPISCNSISAGESPCCLEYVEKYTLQTGLVQCQ